MIKLIACLAVLGALLPSDSVAEKLMLAHVAINPEPRDAPPGQGFRHAGEVRFYR